MKRMGRVHPFLWIWVVAEGWLGQNSFCVVPKLLLAPVMDKVPCFLPRFSSLQAQGTCVGNEQSLGIVLMDWIIDLSEGSGTCAHLLHPFGSLLQRAQILGTGSQWTEQVVREGSVLLIAVSAGRPQSKLCRDCSLVSVRQGPTGASLHLIFKVDRKEKCTECFYPGSW